MSIAHVQDRDDLKTCPYDRSHRVAALKLPMHIVKCARSHKNGERYLTCPYNATHVFRQFELVAHVAECPDKLAVERDFVTKDLSMMGNIVTGNVSVPSYDNDLPAPTEDWEQESSLSREPGYDPYQNMHQLQFRNPDTLAYLKRHEKKKWRESLWGNNRPKDEKTENDIEVMESKFQELRLPRERPQLPPMQTSSQFLGVGRGRPLVDSDYAASEVGSCCSTPPASVQSGETWLSFAKGRGMRLYRNCDVTRDLQSSMSQLNITRDLQSPSSAADYEGDESSVASESSRHRDVEMIDGRLRNLHLHQTN